MSVDLLIERIVTLQNPTVVGLDPNPDAMPPHLLERAKGDNPFERAAAAVTAFNFALIDALCDIVPAVKPQLACYEQLRHEGVRAFYETVRYARQRGMYVIADAKRGDIGSTCDYYANAFLGRVGLAGEELPFVKRCHGYDKMIFVLVKTSNPSSGEFQDRLLEGAPLYERVGQAVEELAQTRLGRYGYGCAGGVVGATYPEQLAALRAAMPHTFFLVPGYGAQGGGAKDAAAAFDARGLGAVVNSSRGIICAWSRHKKDEREFAKAAREEALAMKEELLRAIGHPIGEER